MFLGDIIKNYRKSHGLSQQAFADMCGVSKAYISLLENNKSARSHSPIVPSIDVASRMATVMNISLDDLMSSVDGRQRISLQPYAPAYRAPVFERISAGQPLLANENVIGYEYIDRKDDADYFILCVSGDSMNAARINDGDQIIVLQQDDVDDGDIAVVLVNGNDATVKRIRRQNNTVMLIPMSTNPEHQVQIYGPDVPMRILGKVVEVKFKI